MPNTKLNVYKIVLVEVCERKLNGAEEYIRKKIEELCNEKRIIISRKGNLFVYE